MAQLLAQLVTRADRPCCDREIGRIDHWHQCDRPATVFSDRELSSGGAYRIYYCAVHAKHVSDRGPGYRVVGVGSIIVE